MTPDEIGIEVTLKEPDDFLKVRETLSRIGIASKHEKKLFQSVHILHKQGRYFIIHFKGLFMLDQKPSNYSEEDKVRTKLIAILLDEWGLVKLVNLDLNAKTNRTNLLQEYKIRIIPFKEKHEWELVTKYSIGKHVHHGI